MNTYLNGAEALERIEKGQRPDLMLLDIMMPAMTGYEVCRKLRETFSSSELPIIMLTAKNLVQDLVHGFESGANDYLVKPFTKDELLARVWSQLKLKAAYQTLRENLSLRNELEQRKQTEENLRLVQRRLSLILDRVDDAVIAVNENDEIGFCNRSCEALLGYAARDLLGRSFLSVFPEMVGDRFLKPGSHEAQEDIATSRTHSYREVRLMRADQTPVTAHVLATLLDLEDEPLTALIIRKPSNKKTPQEETIIAGNALAVIEELNRNRNRIQSFEVSLNGLVPKIMEKEPMFLNELKVVDNALKQLGKRLIDDEDLEERRLLGVEVMNLSVGYWTEATLQSKTEMAHRSKLWQVYTNQDGWERAQTLDKYLNISTFPNRPRWNQIIKTADFVLAACDTPSPLRDHLDISLARLRVFL